jgi:hypothetical protein
MYVYMCNDIHDPSFVLSRFLWLVAHGLLLRAVAPVDGEFLST